MAAVEGLCVAFSGAGGIYRQSESACKRQQRKPSDQSWDCSSREKVENEITLENASYLGTSEECTFGYQTTQYNCQLILCYFFFPNPYDSAKYFDRKAHCLALFPPRGQFQKSLAIAERVIKTKQTTDWVYLCSFPSCSLSVVLKYCKSSVANKVNLKKNKNQMSIKGKTYLFYI